ncbi:MAG: MOSC domain-containing protein [Actinomycetia bacterium]|nr:MOSC domain-containing protein [Actinomycetes bacterium]
MHNAHIRSVNVGSVTEQAGRFGPVRTGIVKTPVDVIDVRDPLVRKGAISGVAGDVIASKEHHGGRFQAVYAVAREELDWWSAQIGRDLPDGAFGENLTTAGIDVDAAVLGTRWRVGGAVLEVCGPRVPCQKFARHIAVPRWVRRFAERGRTGAYLMVISPGQIRAGDAIEVGDVPDHGVTVPELFAAISGDATARHRVLAAQCVQDPVVRAELAARD